ncbi:MAG: beta-glucosidase [Kiritimatiellales bacterium]
MKMMDKRRFGARIVVVLLAGTVAQAGDFWYSESDAALKKRAVELRKQLTLEEKVALTHGDFYSGGVPRLKIPELVMSDGPVGIRFSCITRTAEVTKGEVQASSVTRENMPERATMLPATLALAASWDRAAMYKAASIVADEMLFVGGHVLLAPGMNMMRDPRGGRNFEYLGEDPYLTAEMAIQYVRGLQDKGVAANLKHYVANEQDGLRHLTSSRVDEKTLRDVYVYPFERTIREANPWSLMTGNNLLDDVYVSESQFALKEILREQIGFDGVILTDWRSAYKAVPSAKATLDMTTGFCKYVYGWHLLDAVKSGEVSEDLLDAMADRILLLYLRTGVLEAESRQKGAAGIPEFRKTLRGITADSAVLLKNLDGLLPLKSGQKIVLTGPGATRTEAGGGSSAVNRGFERQTIFEGLKNRFGSSVVYQPAKDVDRHADVIVYCAIGPIGHEGSDLDAISLPLEQQDSIRQLGAATDHLVVVLQTSTATDITGWENQADAVLVAWVGGELFGDAVADVLSGAVNPSGRLPCTFGNAIEDYPCARLNTWPAVPVHDQPWKKAGRNEKERNVAYSKAPSFVIDYQEQELIGYRGFIANSIKPVYSFGYGLSYTTFEVNGLEINPKGDDWAVQCTVANTGRKAGADVVQLYVTLPGDKARKLRGFKKVMLAPGESKIVSLKLHGNDLTVFNPESRKWEAPAGIYTIELGDQGAEELPLSAAIRLDNVRTFDRP